MRSTLELLSAAISGVRETYSLKQMLCVCTHAHSCVSVSMFACSCIHVHTLIKHFLGTFKNVLCGNQKLSNWP